MKKLFALLLAGAMTSFALVGCGCARRNDANNAADSQVTDDQAANSGVIAGNGDTSTPQDGLEENREPTQGQIANGGATNNGDNLMDDAGNAVGDVVQGAGNAVGDVANGVENAVDDMAGGTERTARGTTYGTTTRNTRTGTAVNRY